MESAWQLLDDLEVPRMVSFVRRYVAHSQAQLDGRMITDYRGDRSAAAALADVRRVQAELLLELGRLYWRVSGRLSAVSSAQLTQRRSHVLPALIELMGLIDLLGMLGLLLLRSLLSRSRRPPQLRPSRLPKAR